LKIIYSTIKVPCRSKRRRRIPRRRGSMYQRINTWENDSIGCPNLVEGSTSHCKAIASLTLLTVREVWNERNARVFHNKLSLSFVIVDRIKAETRLWVLVGVKKLDTIMPGE
jgi:hypothetical protein